MCGGVCRTGEECILRHLSRGEEEGGGRDVLLAPKSCVWHGCKPALYSVCVSTLPPSLPLTPPSLPSSLLLTLAAALAALPARVPSGLISTPGMIGGGCGGGEVGGCCVVVWVDVCVGRPGVSKQDGACVVEGWWRRLSVLDVEAGRETRGGRRTARTRECGPLLDRVCVVCAWGRA